MDLPDYFCGGAGTINLTDYTFGGDLDLANGTFTEINLTTAIETAIADPTAWSPSSGNATEFYDIRYEQTNTGDCNNLLMETVDVNFSGDAAIADVSVCEDAGVQLLEELAADFDGNVTAGTFTGPGVTDNADGTFTFDPTAVSGMAPIQYCIGDDECEECATFFITVHPDYADATLTAPAAVCSDAGMLNLSSYLNADAAPGTFSASAGTLTMTAAGAMLDVSAVADGTSNHC